VTLEIAAALVHELEDLGCTYRSWVLEDVATRPLNDLPEAIAADLATSQVSIFAVQAQTNELKSRMQMTDIVNRQKIRHAHMVNINKQIMLEGMRADYLRVDRLSTKVVERCAPQTNPRYYVRRNGPCGRHESELPLDQD